MQRIRLQNIPNQSFSITLDGVLYTLRFRSVNRYGIDMTLADISANGETLKTQLRCVPGVPLIPYEYLTVNGANFLFYCINGDYPNYKEFNISQMLIYGTKEEINSLWH